MKLIVFGMSLMVALMGRQDHKQVERQLVDNVEEVKTRSRRAVGTGIALSARLLAMIATLRNAAPAVKQVLFMLPDFASTGVEAAGVGLEITNTITEDQLDESTAKRLEAERLQREQEAQEMRRRLELLENYLIRLLEARLAKKNATIEP